MQRDELKRKIRKLKKLEYKLRFGHAVNISPHHQPRMLWDQYFDLQESRTRRARYSIDALMKMDADALKAVIEAYLAEVYFCAYGIDMRATTTDSDRFDEMDLPFDADPETIKRRYRELAKRHHPDMGGDAEQFIRLKEAFDALRKR